MIDLTNVVNVSDSYGNVVQITDEAGNIIWAVQSDKPVILEVEKITSDTYAGETTYTGEEFILLDIYPKTNGTVSVTYGGLTKTITDTSGTESPNAQQVFFGTFNGASDEVETPASGTLTIEGDYRVFGVGSYYKSSKSIVYDYCGCVTDVIDFGSTRYINIYAFSGCTGLISVTIPENIISIYSRAFLECTGLTSVTICDGVKEIGPGAFANCTGLTSVTIPASVNKILANPFYGCFYNNGIIVASGNTTFKIDGNCLIEIASNRLVAGYADAVIPSYVGTIETNAFNSCAGLKSIAIPSSVTTIGDMAFSGCKGLTEVTFANTSGWYVTETKDGDVSTGTVVDVTDTANNVTLVTDTYRNHYWYCS